MDKDRLNTDEVINLRREECNSIDNYTGGLFCPKEFDGWTCINATPVGTVAHFPCPYFVFGFDPKRMGHRSCLEDGTWFRHPESNKTWSNYTTCVDVEDLMMRTQVNLIYTTGYTVSLAALVISIFIFFYFKSLTCTRIQIHKNLFISLAVNNLLWLVWYEAITDNIPVLIQNGVSPLWMFCEGLYLHTLLVVTFITESKVMPFLYLIGWGVPALLVSLYTALRASDAEDYLLCGRILYPPRLSHRKTCSIMKIDLSSYRFLRVHLKIAAHCLVFNFTTGLPRS